jgi:hypothetical protein
MKCYFKESIFRTLSIVQCFSLKNVSETGFASLLQVKMGEGVAPTLWGPLETASLNHWTYLPTMDDGYSPKERFFEMHHTIVRTLQNNEILYWRTGLNSIDKFK